MLTANPRTAEGYKRWWASQTDAPFGYCWCGCGQRTTVSPQSDSRYGYVKGEPRPHRQGHAQYSLPFAIRQEIAQRYSEGESASSLAERYGASVAIIHSTLRNANVASQQTVLSKEDEALICGLYRDGSSTRAIAERVDVGPTTVKRVLTRCDIATRGMGRYRIHTCDDSFFGSIDTEAKAYWLGFLAADGNINRNSLQVALQYRDSAHLNLLKQSLNASNPMAEYRVGEHKAVSICITSRQLVADLYRHGVVPRKTKLLRWPSTVPSDLLRHYLRGYFDGDGCVWKGKSSYTRKSDGERATAFSWSIVGTEAFCTDAQEFLMSKLGLRRTKLAPTLSSHARVLSYGGNAQVQRISHLLYDDAGIYLPRKRNKVVPFL